LLRVPPKHSAKNLALCGHRGFGARFDHITPKRSSWINCGEADLPCPGSVFRPNPGDSKLFQLVQMGERHLTADPQAAADARQMGSSLADIDGGDVLIQNLAIDVGGADRTGNSSDTAVLAVWSRPQEELRAPRLQC
jgi:hypothetical protein